jgi:hypothetical protein
MAVQWRAARIVSRRQRGERSRGWRRARRESRARETRQARQARQAQAGGDNPISFEVGRRPGQAA